MASNQSTSQSTDQSTDQSTKQSKKTRIWYRHTGQRPVDSIPRRSECEFRGYKGNQEILQDIDSHNIKHRLKSVAKLKDLSISRCDLSDGLPTGILESTSLKKLELVDCRLKNLPLGVTSLTKLKLLDLRYNDFHCGLPEVIAELTSLKELNLCFCDLRNLPTSLCSLSNLRVLNLMGNNLKGGFPEVISEITSLEELDLYMCSLGELTNSLKKLENLKRLNIGRNDFISLPSVVYKLRSLKELNMSGSLNLELIEDKVLKLDQLEEMDCNECGKLSNPPAAVHQQGWPAVKKYFKDLGKARGAEQMVVPVAVVGMPMSGKSSMVKSLKEGTRKLTFRKESSPLDEATKVFCIEDLILKNSHVKLIDYGGHYIYHLTYQLMINELCVPVIVVNMDEFVKLSESRGPKEATRRLCIDWLAHLYVASPRLGPPILVLTHTDKLSGSQFEECKNQLLSNGEIIREEILWEQRQSSTVEAVPILHFSDKNLPLFHQDDIVEFNNVVTETSSIERMKQCIDNRSKDFAMKIPRLWERVEEFIENQTAKPYVKLSDVAKQFSKDDPKIILRYLHNVGKVLWFEKLEGLSDYIFHRIPAITHLIALLFDHSSDDPWKARIEEFPGFCYKQQDIGPRKFQQLVNQLNISGEIDEVLLAYLFDTKSQFPVNLAIQLLQCFYIVHGPIKKEHCSTYILPSFTTNFLSNTWRTDGCLQLKIDIELRGLSVPEYVFQLLTVAVLNHTVSLNTTVKVARNGASIRQGECATHIVHNSSNRRITLQVSTSVKGLGRSWKLLLENAHVVRSLLSEVWKACRSETLVYCAHCLFLRDQNPSYDVNPHWLRSANLEDISKAITGSAMELTACTRSDPTADELIPTVPQALVRACLQLESSEIEDLQSYLQQQESGDTPCSQDVNYDEIAAIVEAAHQDSDSDLSDVEEKEYCVADPDGERVDMIMRLKPVSKHAIRLLYDNTEKVYPMTDRVRGRVLIINIKSFSDKGETRDGSEVDYRNISMLFKALKFDIAKSQNQLTDLTAEEIYTEIKEETQRREHKNLGMFVMVIMSHGERGDVILDYHKNQVPLIKIQDLLSPREFPAMKGKPKLFIVQACSGVRPDYGDTIEVPSTPADVSAAGTSDASAGSQQSISSPTASAASGGIVFNVQRHPEPLKAPSAFNADDFFIMKASSESYLASRSITHGSWFIRVLVATFYNHSRHRYVETLFKIIQSRVRQVSMSAKHTESESYQGGNVPTSVCTFTNFRKLYLFPGLPKR